jgi:DNA-binding MarR family transcriptional regulator
MVKQELLEFLEAYPGSATTDVAGQFGLLYATAAMALLRLSRQGLVARAVNPYGVFQYALTERGHERLDYFRDRTDAGSTIKHAKTHTGTYHCPACMIEFGLVAETSLKCDACQGPLAAGSLDEIWDGEDEPG